MNKAIIVRDDLVTIILGSKQFFVYAEQPKFKDVTTAIKNKVSDDDLLSLLEGIEAEKTKKAELDSAYLQAGGIEFKEGTIYYQGKPLANSIVARIETLFAEGYPIEPMVKFLENVMENPSYQSQNELYDFLEHEGLPITEDGHFLAYKAIREDWTDKYSGTVLNTIGAVIEMPRGSVDDNRNNACSKGYHVGALEYVYTFGHPESGDRIVMVKVNPRDAVSVPYDHSCHKLRVCKYEVISEYQGKINQPLVTGVRDEKYDTNVSTYDKSTVDTWFSSYGTEENDCGNCGCNCSDWDEDDEDEWDDVNDWDEEDDWNDDDENYDTPW